MFHDIPKSILERMKYLEAIDAQDRVDGTDRMKRLRQIPPETGKFIALQAALAPKGNIIEIGTSAGYSALWLSLTASLKNCKVITFEVLKDKAALARETFRAAGVDNQVELIEGDALKHLKDYKNIPFCFLDAEKEVYSDCYDLVVPNLAPDGILIADNVISHKETLQLFVDNALRDNIIDAMVIPIGKGLLFCRKI
jgi:predicted O-methyltransferase YrrM